MINRKYRTKFEVLIDELTVIFTDESIPRKIRVQAGRLSMDVLDDMMYIDFHRLPRGDIITILNEYSIQQMEIYKQI